MALPTVFISRALGDDVLAPLSGKASVDLWPEERPPTADELREHASSADGLLTMLTERIDATLLDACPRLRVVSNLAVGVDNLDLEALTARGIPAGHTPGVLTDATADLALALLLAVARRIVEARDAILAGEWTSWRPTGFLGLELSGATLGIVGTGRIGAAVAHRARAFNMELLGWSRTQRPIEGLAYVGFDELLARSDVVSVNVALTEETRHLIGAPELAKMKKGAILINTARGAVVDQRALYASLAAGHLGGAGLDVYEVEPVPLDEPLLHLPQVVAIPHLGSATQKTRRAMADRAVENLLAGIAGEQVRWCANPGIYH